MAVSRRALSNATVFVPCNHVLEKIGSPVHTSPGCVVVLQCYTVPRLLKCIVPGTTLTENVMLVINLLRTSQRYLFPDNAPVLPYIFSPWSPSNQTCLPCMLIFNPAPQISDFLRSILTLAYRCIVREGKRAPCIRIVRLGEALTKWLDYS